MTDVEAPIEQQAAPAAPETGSSPEAAAPAPVETPQQSEQNSTK